MSRPPPRTRQPISSPLFLPLPQHYLVGVPRSPSRLISRNSRRDTVPSRGIPIIRQAGLSNFQRSPSAPISGATQYRVRPRQNRQPQENRLARIQEESGNPFDSLREIVFTPSVPIRPSCTRIILRNLSRHPLRPTKLAPDHQGRAPPAGSTHLFAQSTPSRPLNAPPIVPLIPYNNIPRPENQFPSYFANQPYQPPPVVDRSRFVRAETISGHGSTRPPTQPQTFQPHPAMGGFGNGGPPSSSSSPSFPEGRGPPPPPPPGRQPGDWTPFGGDEPPSSGGRPPPPPNGFPGGGFPGDGSPGGGPPSGGPPEGHFQGNFSSYPEDRRPIIYVEQPQSQPRSYKAHAREPDRFSGKDPRKSKSSLSSASFSSRMTSSRIQLTNEKSTPPSPISKDWHSIGLLPSSLPLPFRPC